MDVVLLPCPVTQEQSQTSKAKSKGPQLSCHPEKGTVSRFYRKEQTMEFKDALKYRQSCRAYQEAQITDAQLQEILDAAYLAPVGMGKFENFRLVAVQDKAVLDKMNDLFGNKVGDKSMRPTYGAPTVIFVLENAEDDDLITGANCSCLIENMMLAASSLKLGACYLFGICRVLEKEAEVKKMLQIPDGFRLVGGVTVGIPAEELQQRQVEDGKIQTIRI